MAFPYRLLGKPFICPTICPQSRRAKAVLYGDYAALACNMRENVSVEVLSEVRHAARPGVVAWFEFDSKIMDNKGLPRW